MRRAALLCKLAVVAVAILVGIEILRPVRRSPVQPPVDWERNAAVLLAPGKRVVAVAAHPDDVEFYIGGTLARLHDAGAHVTLILGTDGNKSRYYPGFLSRRLARTRAAEAVRAGRILGYNVLFLHHPDGRLADTPGVPEEIAARLRELRPDTLLTFDSANLWGIRHPDHRAAGRFALRALAETGQRPEVFLFSTQRPNTWIDVSSTIDRKWKALKAHASQFGPFRLWLIRSKLLGPTARWEGEKIGARYAEVFRRMSPAELGRFWISD